MKKLCLMIVFGFGLLQAAAADLEWLTAENFPKALEQAKAGNKVILIDFTGSDWCGFCKLQKQEVFETKEFAKYAGEKLVLVVADFPRRIEQSEALKKANQELRDTYATPFGGFPTTVIVGADGKKRGEKIGYPPGSGPEAYIKEIEKIAN